MKYWKLVREMLKRAINLLFWSYLTIQAAVNSNLQKEFICKFFFIFIEKKEILVYDTYRIKRMEGKYLWIMSFKTSNLKILSQVNFK